MAHPSSEFEPFSPSWYDRLESFLFRLPGPYWAVWILLVLALFGLPLFIIWLRTGFGFGELDPTMVLSIVQGAYFAVLIQYLDEHALASLEELKPHLRFPPEKFDGLRHHLQYLPARPTAGLALLTALVIPVVVVLMGAPFAVPEDNPPMLILASFAFFFVWLMNLLMVFHLFQRARVMFRVLTEHTELSLFQQREVHSYALQGSRFAMLFMTLPLVWTILQPGLASLIIVLIFGLISLVTFFYPVWGVHRELARRKRDLLATISGKLEKEIGIVARGDGEPGSRPSSMDELEKAHSIVAGRSTWPWSPGAFRQLMAAITLPTVVWLLQYFLGRLIALP